MSEQNNIGWESFKPTGMNNVRAISFKRKDITIHDRVKNTLNRWRYNEPNKTTKLKSIKPTLDKLKKMREEVDNQILLSNIKKELSRFKRKGK